MSKSTPKPPKTQASPHPRLPDGLQRAGVLKNSVNFFRGDVNHTQSLFTLPGRSDGDGLQIDFGIAYQSNINRRRRHGTATSRPGCWAWAGACRRR